MYSLVRSTGFVARVTASTLTAIPRPPPGPPPGPAPAAPSPPQATTVRATENSSPAHTARGTRRSTDTKRSKLIRSPNREGPAPRAVNNLLTISLFNAEDRLQGRMAASRYSIVTPDFQVCGAGNGSFAASVRAKFVRGDKHAYGCRVADP